MVFPTTADYDNSAFNYSGGKRTFQHKALYADKLRYTWNYGMNWSDWRPWESSTTIDSKQFVSLDIYDGDHIIVQCEWFVAWLWRFDNQRGDPIRLVRYCRLRPTRRACGSWFQPRDAPCPAIPRAWPVQPVGVRQGHNSVMTKNNEGQWELGVGRRADTSFFNLP